MQSILHCDIGLPIVCILILDVVTHWKTTTCIPLHLTTEECEFDLSCKVYGRQLLRRTRDYSGLVFTDAFLMSSHINWNQ